VEVAQGLDWRGALRDALRARPKVKLRPQANRASAAVLVPIVERDGELYLWLLRRASHLRKHRGEVAFPGGKQDEADADLVATALREADEEVGLGAGHLEVLGAMDELLTFTGFGVTPVVAAIEPGWAPAPNADEVAAVFLAPLGRFAARPAWSTPFGYVVDDHWVWGATAKMARQCASIAEAAFGPRA
jgi:8-oxo-dGTP pyrophosphatase MutT (NUDIX family)